MKRLLFPSHYLIAHWAINTSCVFGSWWSDSDTVRKSTVWQLGKEGSQPAKKKPSPPQLSSLINIQTLETLPKGRPPKAQHHTKLIFQLKALSCAFFFLLGWFYSESTLKSLEESQGSDPLGSQLVTLRLLCSLPGSTALAPGFLRQQWYYSTGSSQANISLAATTQLVAWQHILYVYI